MAECFGHAAPAKLAITEFYQTELRWPADVDEAGIADPAGRSQYCDGFQHYKQNEGSFEINVNESAVGVLSTKETNFQLMPDPTAEGGINWYCLSRHTNTPELKYLPSSCRCKDLACAKG